MNLFLGANTHKLDSKGRLFVPKRILEGINDPGERNQFVLSLGLDPCLGLFTRKGFMAYMAKLEQTAFEDPDFREAARGLAALSVEQTLDSQGRILIPEELRGMIQLGNEAIVVGVFDRVEIWDAKLWRESAFEKARSAYLEKAAQLFKRRPPSQGADT